MFKNMMDWFAEATPKTKWTLGIIFGLAACYVGCAVLLLAIILLINYFYQCVIGGIVLWLVIVVIGEMRNRGVKLSIGFKKNEN